MKRRRTRRRRITLIGFVKALFEYVKIAYAEDDRVESLHSHVCGPQCWHHTR